MTSPSNPAAPGAVAFCAACGSPLAAGARFCHRCGTPYGQGIPAGRASGGSAAASVLPWGVAFVALLALVAMFAGRNFGSARGSSVDGSSNALPTTAIDGAAPRGSPPDISNMSPNQQANMLFIRLMTYAERGAVDSVAFFAPMAMGAHEMLTNPTLDERYHFGLIAEVIGDSVVARAQADTILAAQPASLLGLMLAASAARMTNNAPAAASFDRRFADALSAELATGNQDYELHKREIDRATLRVRGGGSNP